VFYWLPTYAEEVVTVIVGRGELKEDEAVNMRAIAFSLKPREGGGGNLDLMDAGQILFAVGLRKVSVNN
jgi:hypothetical protein